MGHMSWSSGRLYFDFSLFFARCQVGDAIMSSRCALNTSKLKHHDPATYKWCPFCAHTNTMIHEGESLWSRTSWIYVCSSWIGHADFRLEHLCFPVESLKALDVYRNHWGLSLQSATGSVNFHGALSNLSALSQPFLGGLDVNFSQVANHVFLLDPWWNPACEMQAGQAGRRTMVPLWPGIGRNFGCLRTHQKHVELLGSFSIF